MAVTDNFNRADAGTLGANWTTNEGGGLQVASNQAKGVSGAYNGAYWSANSFNADQSSQAVKANGSDYQAVGVRMAASQNWYGYFNHADLQKSVGGSISSIGGGFSVSNGDTFRIVATGTALDVYINGVLKVSTTDASLASGAPGLLTYDPVGALDDWQGTGEIVGGGGVGSMFWWNQFGRVHQECCR